ncbi:Rap1-interacting factor 1 N terminal-domain-containing protein [Paraphoma chrysanthemicola]|uniref:Rap1-interacting factor 1 N terminal-domain-containing protein n=1 Tax=Paraphoma chrysanthemicola TaxID=798071 RepID=A0A8K0RHZ2_9PLEO|nr:Rap1-interacting factor 1 N terminal-domain-containing protein [Paraphoma chrysanthemicola]
MVFSKFDSLSVRPPTPPLHDHVQDVDETLQFLEDPFGEKPALPKSIAATKNLLNTPEQSPSSDISIPSSSASRQKRVEFELQTCSIPRKKAVAQSWTPTRSSPLRPLPQTRVSKPLKSILKPSDATPTPPPADEAAAAHKFKTFAEMLESIVKLLASQERPSRMDAYHSLQRTMQAYDKIPDDHALKQKMPLLTQFIRRDMQAPSPTGTGLDSQLIMQALKMLMALFRISEAAAAMDDDFCAFVVDRSIQVAADDAMPKIVVNTHLATLMQQNFRAKIMSIPRVEKILEVLDTIHDRVGGFSVQAYRIRIHRKLIQQRPDVMIKHTERWFRLTVRALMAAQKDINQSALDICLSAAKTIGHDRVVAKSCLAVLNRVRSDGDPFAKAFAKELERMLGGDNAVLVPQIWAAVTILLKDSLYSNMFTALKDWLEVFEKCIVSPKDAVRVQTNVAFCFLLYSVNLSQNTSEAWTRMFVKIPLHQLQRRVPAKKADRDAISSGYLTLLYYAFQPTATPEQLDRYWREFVVAFWSQLLHVPQSTHAYAACRILSALLNGSRKPWNDQRPLDQRPQYMIQRQELPLLDPKWVRRSLASVLPFVESLLDATPWAESEQQEDKPVRTMWLAVLDSLVEASSKEVMASTDTKDAMAQIVNLLRRVWTNHTAQLALSQQKEDTWANKFCFLIDSVVQKLGSKHFADKFLTRSEADDFEFASTPSHRSRQHAPRVSPLLNFIDLLVNQSEGKLPDAVRLRAIKLILEPCFNAQNTRLSKLELLRDCSAVVDSFLQSTVAADFWSHVASLLSTSLQEQNLETSEQVSRQLGKEYDLVVELLGFGLTHFPASAWRNDAPSLFIDTVRKEAGDGAVILAAIEKISEIVAMCTTEEAELSCLSYVTIVLRNLPKQTSRRILEQSRQTLWPSSPAPGRRTDFDPYTHLYKAISSVGAAAYQQLHGEQAEASGRFIKALAISVKDCSTPHLAVYLRKTQEVIRTWVEDPARKLQNTEQPMKAVHREVIGLWTEVCNAIERLPRKDAQILLHLEPLLTAGFVSRRRSIVNISIVTWNKTFGKEDSLRYPAHLEQALRRLRPTVEIVLPSLEPCEEDAIDDLSFYESDNSTEDIRPTYKSPRVKESPFKITKSTRRSLTRSPAVPSPASRRTSARQTPKVRLRHDNSQIQFEPIVSSPSNPFNQESQVLTDRQKEMIERQRLSSGLFANIGAPSPQKDDAPSPMELHSDALTADELPTETSRATPLKALAAMGPMDVFLGSSPTPHARRSSRKIVSDEISLATPTAVRTVKLANDDNLGSSPPRFEKPKPVNEQLNSDIQAESSFEYRQPETLYYGSFDEGTTIDEDALLEAAAMRTEAENHSEVTASSDAIMSEVPSSNVDLQLTAQLDADIQAHMAAGKEETENREPESINDFVDAASHPQPSLIDDRGSDTELDESQRRLPATDKPAHINTDEDTSSTSRVDDSFSRPSSDKGTPRSQSLRRSSRHSAASSPAQSPSKKRKSLKAEQKETSDVHDQTLKPQLQYPDKDGMLDNIVVASPASRSSKPTKKRKSMNHVESSHIIVPNTHMKRGPVRRSQSLLSQVENSQDVLVEDTPAPKRAKQAATQDVSDVKHTPPTPPPPPSNSQNKRLSHVQVTPKRSSEYGSSIRSSSVAAESEQPHSQPQTQPETQLRVPDQAETSASTPSRSFTERVILTPRSIINQLKSLKDYLFSAGARELVIGREEEREIDDALFDIRRVVHAAGVRGEESAKK